MDVLTAFEQNKMAIGRFVQRLNIDVSVEDVLQETFAKAFKVELRRPISQPKSYLFRIAKHIALKKLSMQQRWKTVPDYDELPADYSAEEIVIAGESADLLMKRINMLSKQTRRVYWLRVLDELPLKQISARLGISVSTVEKHCNRVHKIQRELNSQE